MKSGMVWRARDLACRAHAGQVDKAGLPYIEHVKRVVRAVEGDDAKCVAYLHDVLEDAPQFIEEVRLNFPWAIVVAVDKLTRLPRESSKAYYKAISGDELARQVKLADIADNASEERLALLDEKTAARLRRKYEKAIEALKK